MFTAFLKKTKLDELIAVIAIGIFLAMIFPSDKKKKKGWFR